MSFLCRRVDFIDHPGMKRIFPFQWGVFSHQESTLLGIKERDRLGIPTLVVDLWISALLNQSQETHRCELLRMRTTKTWSAYQSFWGSGI